MCKFITKKNTMNQIMAKASKHLQVPELERQQWMATFAHIMRGSKSKEKCAHTGFAQVFEKEVTRTTSVKYNTSLTLYLHLRETEL
jgi:GMP synthase PP-ATPase subunit